MATDLPFNDGEQIPDLGEGGQNIHDDLVSLIQALDQVYVGDDAESVISDEASEYAIGLDTQGDTELVTAGSGSADVPLEVDGEDISQLKGTLQDYTDNELQDLDSKIQDDMDDLADEIDDDIQGETDTTIEEVEEDLESTTTTESDDADVETAEYVEIPKDSDGNTFASGDLPNQGAETRGGRSLVYDSESDVPDDELPDGTMVYVDGEGLFVVE